MGDFRAIGGVSASLQSLLLDRMELPGEMTSCPVTVSTPRADQESGGDTEGFRINLFLYQVSENGYLKNMEIPGHGHPGQYGKPPLSLDLHYLLTAYGTTAEEGDFVNETLAHQLLGSAMRVLHDHPVITGNLTTLRAPIGRQILHISLQDEFEEIKLCLDPIGLEDLSKVWTALTLPYRLSAAYKVSVVQIECRQPRRIGIPVETRRIHMDITRRPVITSVYRTPTPPHDAIGEMRVIPGDRIVIEGRNFAYPRTLVRIGDLDPVAVRPETAERIQTTVPETGLQAGMQTVEVLIEKQTEVIQGALDRGVTTDDRSLARSNQAPIMVLPAMDGISPTAGDHTVTLTVTGERLWHQDAKTFVMVGDVSIQVRQPEYEAGLEEPAATRIQVPLQALAQELTGLASGNYELPVRVMVDGAISSDSIIFTYQVP